MEEHVEHPLPPALTPYVRRICGYRITGCRPGTHIGLPSAGVTCVFDLAQGLRLSGLDLREVTRFGASFSGLHLSPATIHHDGSQHGIMLYLTPTGVHDLFGVPAAELMGTAVDPTALIGRAADDLAARLREAPGWASLGILAEALLARVPERPRDDTAARVWALLEADGGRSGVDRLARESGWSVRYLRRRFTTEFGIGPKAAARLMRFERSVDVVSRASSLAEAAWSSGYADQAHLTREWRRFAGVGPSTWLGLEEFAPVEEPAHPHRPLGGSDAPLGGSNAPLGGSDAPLGVRG